MCDYLMMSIKLTLTSTSCIMSVCDKERWFLSDKLDKLTDFFLKIGNGISYINKDILNLFLPSS